MFNGEIMKAFPLIAGMRQIPVISLLFNISWKSQTEQKAIREIKGIGIENKQINLSLFESYMIIYNNL